MALTVLQVIETEYLPDLSWELHASTDFWTMGEKAHPGVFGDSLRTVVGGTFLPNMQEGDLCSLQRVRKGDGVGYTHAFLLPTKSSSKWCKTLIFTWGCTDLSFDEHVHDAPQSNFTAPCTNPYTCDVYVRTL